MQTTKSQQAGERTQISFEANKAEFKIIIMIAQRASALAMRNGLKYDVLTANMDISACHANGMPLKLVDLLEADESTFAHDVFGIRRHINRDTGRIENFFVPHTAQ